MNRIALLESANNSQVIDLANLCESEIECYLHLKDRLGTCMFTRIPKRNVNYKKFPRQKKKLFGFDRFYEKILICFDFP